VDQSGNLRFTANPVLKVNHPVNQGIPNTIVPNLVAAFESSHWAQHDIDAAKWAQATIARSSITIRQGADDASSTNQ
jgi:hypothetical protein